MGFLIFVCCSLTLILPVVSSAKTVDGRIIEVSPVRSGGGVGDFGTLPGQMLSSLRVKVQLNGGGFFSKPKAYLGCTIHWVDAMTGTSYSRSMEYNELDIDALKVAGDGMQNYEIKLGRGGFGFRVVGWTVALWREKIENCGCKYCKKNGYHMEGQIDRKSSNWN